MANEDILGKKLFFLYPSALICNQVIPQLIQQEYEVYVIRDQAKLKRLLRKFPNSIVFANICEGMTAQEWEAWVRGVMADSALKTVSVGVICSVGDEALRDKYLNKIKITCGYTVLQSNPTDSLRSILGLLKAAGAKGRRKYLRADTSGEANTTVNFPIDGTFVNGAIKDISVVGLSCVFDIDPDLTKNALFQEVQIRLQTSLLKVDGIIFGFREEMGKKVYVVLFTQRIDPDVRARIRTYIQGRLQSKMDALMKMV